MYTPICGVRIWTDDFMRSFENPVTGGRAG